MSETDRLGAVFERELWTVLRTWTYIGLALGFAFILLSVAVITDASGYAPLVLALLTPTELLVPVLAAAFGYRSILLDRESDELAIIRTFPVDRHEYVSGVYFGRLTVLLVTIVGTLLLVSIVVPLVGEAEAALSRFAGLDSPMLYLRFVVLTAVFGATMLGIMVMVSALAETTRRGIVLVVLFFLVLSIGFDIAAIAGFSSGLSGVGSLLAVSSPNGAYRQLVLAFVIAPVSTTTSAAYGWLLSLFVLVFWLLGTAVLTLWGVWVPSRFLAE